MSCCYQEVHALTKSSAVEASAQLGTQAQPFTFVLQTRVFGTKPSQTATLKSVSVGVTGRIPTRQELGLFPFSAVNFVLL